ncbi:hypothetical protein KJS94_10875 [Flavihumibacter rivuli]|uniref:hypothetical protein n=1 Tax=Flavihumibacter rivuli TaxID=2838156 RepID=UPI001BDF18F8|nr:hypothetical protein [Flavihumibacter rivuli]ULQ55143.1 hypothetical protein KJS94_10875 [Flavihumibacter rivuli]
MYIIRDIFYLHFGHFKAAKALMDEARSNKLMPEAKAIRVLSDFTGHSYRLIMEEGFSSLAEYEQSLSAGMGQGDWKNWYEKFKSHVAHSEREILKVVD